MSTESASIASPYRLPPIPVASMSPVRLWPAVALVALYWGCRLVVDTLDKPYFYGFLYNLGSAGLLVLLYFAWWWTRRRIRFVDRLYGFLLIVGGGLIAIPLCHPSIGWFGILTAGMPLVLAVWTVWLIGGPKVFDSQSRLASFLVVAVTWASLTLVRIEGVNAELKPDLHWRWSPTAEEQFLAEMAPPTSQPADWTPALQPGDWPAFRGADRDGVIHGVTLATDWKAAPPRLRWRRRVGPAWSSVIIVNGRLFTQEQHGDQEAVVAYDGLTGQPLWVHEDPARFWEQVSGAGPRATPTFADGRLYTRGGTGILNCLDAVTGSRHWSHDLAAEVGAPVPMWGCSGSPLVVDDLVIVFAGGEGSQSLRAYRAATGDPVWAAPAGALSYSSLQLATLDGVRQCLMLSEQGLTAVEPATGKVLWTYGLAMPGAPRTIQPHVLGPTQLVVGTLQGPSTSLIEVTHAGDTWNVAERWTSKDLKPEFPDLVVHNGHAYGFDVSLFCCIDLATGKRCWKGGRYGRGQVMLLPESSRLLIVSEEGELVLLAANPERHEELGRFRALGGKTWNHPVIAHGRLYVRNAEEMACYDLEPGKGS